jgi:hypothetical protein
MFHAGTAGMEFLMIDGCRQGYLVAESSPTVRLKAPYTVSGYTVDRRVKHAEDWI